ncbi:MAG: TenA family transcriptional regulator [Chloroflexota bacterium]
MMETFESPQHLIKRIKDEVEARHPFMHHPFFAELRGGKISREELAIFAKQLWGIPKYNYAVAGGKISQLQPLPQFPLGMGKPYDLHVMKHFVEILVDEVGKEVLEYSPTGGHYELYLQFTDALGIPREEMESMDIFYPRTLHFINDWVNTARTLPLIESAISMNFVNEMGFSAMGIALHEALTEHYGFTDEQVAFFSVHGVEDAHHSSIGEYLIETYATTADMQHRVWLAALRGIGMYSPIIDGVWEVIQEQRQGGAGGKAGAARVPR